MGKLWQDGETSLRRNDAYRSEILEPRDKMNTELVKALEKTAV